MQHYTLDSSLVTPAVYEKQKCFVKLVSDKILEQVIFTRLTMLQHLGAAVFF